MRIAWRYNNLDKVDSEQGSQKDGRNSYTFDLSQSIDGNALKSLEVTLLGKDNGVQSPNAADSIFHNPAYVSVIKKLNEKLSEPAFDASGNQTSNDRKNLLRICIESFGSPLWYGDHCSDDICLFLTILKAAVRTSLSVCCISAPTHLFKFIVSARFYTTNFHILHAILCFSLLIS